jgi:hypothetical protein
MSSPYDFIIDDMTFSYSNLSSFENCAYGWKLNYIDDVERLQNFYAEYGLLNHKVFEKYFTGELESHRLSDWYKSNWGTFVKHSPPRYPVGLEKRYEDEGQIFFDFFSFDKSHYEVLMVEGSISLDINGVTFIAKPDLVLKDNNTGKICLVDYKTSSPFTKGKNGILLPEKKKLDKYYQQMYIYTHALWKARDIHTDEITLWFPRLDKTVTIEWKDSDEIKAIEWLQDVVEKIKNEEVFDYGKPGEYFCHNLCSVRNFCKYGK